MDSTLGVAELLDRVESSITAVLPGPVWVRGEVSGFKRTAGGAGFFDLVDTESNRFSLGVSARGRVMAEIDHLLNSTGLGSLRSGIEIRAQGTVGLVRERSQIRFSLLKVDPEFIAGRLAVDRDDVIRRLTADGTLSRNRKLSLPLVPLRVGLLTSRGSDAHADFLDQLGSSGYRFSVRTVHSLVQGDRAPDEIATGLSRLARSGVDLVAVVRGGGSKLDLAPFDSEVVARAIAAMPIPVVTGIGHETDRSIADEAAAHAEKTPTAIAGWLVSRVADYAGRVERGREFIVDGARRSMAHMERDLSDLASRVGSVRLVLDAQHVALDRLAESIVVQAPDRLRQESYRLERLAELFSALGVEATLGRGFALALRDDGSVVTKAGDLVGGERLQLRFADGTVGVTVVPPEEAVAGQ